MQGQSARFVFLSGSEGPSHGEIINSVNSANEFQQRVLEVAQGEINDLVGDLAQTLLNNGSVMGNNITEVSLILRMAQYESMQRNKDQVIRVQTLLKNFGYLEEDQVTGNWGDEATQTAFARWLRGENPAPNASPARPEGQSVDIEAEPEAIRPLLNFTTLENPTSAQVRTVQQILFDRGFFAGASRTAAVDGVRGPMTNAAYRRWLRGYTNSRTATEAQAQSAGLAPENARGRASGVADHAENLVAANPQIEHALNTLLTSRETLRSGSQGSQVTALQNAIFHLQNTLSFSVPTGFRVDGAFGPMTARAVRALQNALGVSADGVFGSGTRRALAARVGRAAPAEALTPQGRVDRVEQTAERLSELLGRIGQTDQWTMDMLTQVSNTMGYDNIIPHSHGILGFLFDEDLDSVELDHPDPEKTQALGGLMQRFLAESNRIQGNLNAQRTQNAIDTALRAIGGLNISLFSIRHNLWASFVDAGMDVDQATGFLNFVNEQLAAGKKPDDIDVSEFFTHWNNGEYYGSYVQMWREEASHFNRLLREVRNLRTPEERQAAAETLTPMLRAMVTHMEEGMDRYANYLTGDRELNAHLDAIFNVVDRVFGPSYSYVTERVDRIRSLDARHVVGADGDPITNDQIRLAQSRLREQSRLLGEINQRLYTVESESALEDNTFEFRTRDTVDSDRGPRRTEFSQDLARRGFREDVSPLAASGLLSSGGGYERERYGGTNEQLMALELLKLNTNAAEINPTSPHDFNRLFARWQVGRFNEDGSQAEEGRWEYGLTFAARLELAEMLRDIDRADEDDAEYTALKDMLESAGHPDFSLTQSEWRYMRARMSGRKFDDNLGYGEKRAFEQKWDTLQEIFRSITTQTLNQGNLKGEFEGAGWERYIDRDIGQQIRAERSRARTGMTTEIVQTQFNTTTDIIEALRNGNVPEVVQTALLTIEGFPNIADAFLKFPAPSRVEADVRGLVVITRQTGKTAQAIAQEMQTYLEEHDGLKNWLEATKTPESYLAYFQQYITHGIQGRGEAQRIRPTAHAARLGVSDALIARLGGGNSVDLTQKEAQALLDHFRTPVYSGRNERSARPGLANMLNTFAEHGMYMTPQEFENDFRNTARLIPSSQIDARVLNTTRSLNDTKAYHELRNADHVYTFDYTRERQVQVRSASGGLETHTLAVRYQIYLHPDCSNPLIVPSQATVDSHNVTQNISLPTDLVLVNPGTISVDIPVGVILAATLPGGGGGTTTARIPKQPGGPPGQPAPMF